MEYRYGRRYFRQGNYFQILNSILETIINYQKLMTFEHFSQRKNFKIEKDAMEKWIFSNERVNIISDIHKEVVSRVIE